MKSAVNIKTIANYAIWIMAMASFNAFSATETSVVSAASALPVAYVVMGASDGGRAAVAIPVALSVAGSTLLVKAVEASARGVVCVLERASDGASTSVEIVGRGFQSLSLVAGSVVTVSVVGTGSLLSAAGQVIAVIPNELGRTLMHNQRLTP